MNIKSGIVSALVMLAVAPAANAGSAAGRINHINYMPSGAVLVVLDGPVNAPAACNVAQRFAVDTTNPAGKAQLAGLLMAQANSKNVSIFGTGQCQIWGDTESVSYIVI